ncbi:hypothetical protein NLU13_8606 [Sarocladium strictum]|uniref:Dehydrogenase FUB6 n=1 Tax=Sarocladium strictum TaxID=5046 RepID=A0AA39GC02_SARSR|nr:hypothetical protein NLU13_8606 [Sarocladium strictum]
MGRDNLSIHLAERPKDDIVPGKTFSSKVTPAPTEADLKDGEILVEALYLALEPSMKVWMSTARSYMPPVGLGHVMRGAAACRVLASRNKHASVGDYVSAWCGWTQYAIVQDGRFEPASRYPGLQSPRDMLSTLGITGLTAWWGMTQIGDPKPGETVVVSGAAGATGSVAGQIAKIKGARVIGICGNDDKCRWLKDDLGFDVALNYKSKDFRKAFKEATKDYIDVYYDNVGGDILDMALARAKEHARFVECGVISQYNTSNPQGPKYFSNVVAMRIRMQGFIITDHTASWPKGRQELSKWIAEGKMKKSETIIKGGLEAAEGALIGLYNGVNQGKLMVEIKDESKTPAKL